MASLEQLPMEIIHYMMNWLEPFEVARLCMTCTWFAGLDNRTTWKELLLRDGQYKKHFMGPKVMYVIEHVSQPICLKTPGEAEGEKMADEFERRLDEELGVNTDTYSLPPELSTNPLSRNWEDYIRETAELDPSVEDNDRSFVSGIGRFYGDPRISAHLAGYNTNADRAARSNRTFPHVNFVGLRTSPLSSLEMCYADYNKVIDVATFLLGDDLSRAGIRCSNTIYFPVNSLEKVKRLLEQHKSGNEEIKMENMTKNKIISITIKKYIQHRFYHPCIRYFPRRNLRRFI